MGDVKRALLYVAHWNFFGVVGGVILGAAFAVIGLQQFGLGYALFALGGVWSLAHWATSSFLSEKQRLTKGRAVRRDLVGLRRARLQYWGWLFAVSMLIIVAFGSCEAWVLYTKQKYERDDTLQHLSIDVIVPHGDESRPEESLITVTNGGSSAIEKHALVCTVNLEVGFPAFPTASSTPTKDTPATTIRDLTFTPVDKGGWLVNSSCCSNYSFSSVPMEAGGDAQTVNCLKAISPTPGIRCADILLDFAFYVSGQPKDLLHKKERLTTQIGPSGFVWKKELIGMAKSPCESYVSQQ